MMREEDLKKLIKGANQLHKSTIFAKPTTGGKVKLWIYYNYERSSLRLPSLQINSRTIPEEVALLKKAIEMRNSVEDGGNSAAMSMANKNRLLSTVIMEWSAHYSFDVSKGGAKIAGDKFLSANGDMAVGEVKRRHLIRMIDFMRQSGFHSNYIRSIASRFRAFCNWAEQRGYMDRVDTRKLLPPEVFGEVKALSEEELRLLAAAPCEDCPDVKDLFMLGIYTAQRIGEIKNYTFSMLYNEKIKTRQGKTGKFIVIPLSDRALGIMRELKARRESEGKNTGDNDKIFNLPSNPHVCRIFKRWLEAAGLSKDRITPHNSRSTAISLLINKGVPESVTQELANHSDPKITARYYRQIDDNRKKEALAKIPEF